MATTSHCASSPSEPARLTVGLTGGIGSGKTVVADRLAALGAAVIDTDAIARALTAPGGAAMAPIAAAFGPGCLDPHGALDRARMRERVFGDAAAKARLEAILHPMIRAEAQAAAAGAAPSAPYIVFVVPLLVESGGWRDRVDRVLVIDCTVATQEARVSARSGLDAALARTIIDQQASRGQRLAAADDVLFNEGPLEELMPRVDRLHARYLALSRGGRGRV